MWSKYRFLTRKSTSPFGTSGRPTFVNVQFLPKYTVDTPGPAQLQVWRIGVRTPNKQRSSRQAYLSTTVLS